MFFEKIIEVQKSNNDEPFINVPDVTMVYISTFDMFKKENLCKYSHKRRFYNSRTYGVFLAETKTIE